MSNLKCLYLVGKLSYIEENFFQSQLFSAAVFSACVVEES